MEKNMDDTAQGDHTKATHRRGAAQVHPTRATLKEIVRRKCEARAPHKGTAVCKKELYKGNVMEGHHPKAPYKECKGRVPHKCIAWGQWKGRAGTGTGMCDGGSEKGHSFVDSVTFLIAELLNEWNVNSCRLVALS